MIHACLKNCNNSFDKMKITQDIVDRNYNRLTAYAERKTSLTEWMEIWQKLMLDMLNANFRNLSELDQYLEKKGKRIVYIVDGLEDVFMDLQIQKQETWRLAIRALCQNIVNTLRNLRFGNIGIVIFVRKDMAEEAIEINFEQFQNQYHKYEYRLDWRRDRQIRESGLFYHVRQKVLLSGDYQICIGI